MKTLMQSGKIAKVFGRLWLGCAVICSSLLMPMQSFADEEDEGRREVIEIAYPLRLSMDAAKLTGFVDYKFCKSCKAVKLHITPTTKAYENDKEVALVKVKDRLGLSAEIVYNSKTKNIIAFSWAVKKR